MYYKDIGDSQYLYNNGWLMILPKRQTTLMTLKILLYYKLTILLIKDTKNVTENSASINFIKI